MAKKSSEVLAQPTAIAERLDYTEIGYRAEGQPEIRVKLKPLTYIQRVFCDSKRQVGMSVDRSAPDEKDWRVLFDPNSIAEYVQWVLRLGIESAEGIAWNTEATRVAGRTYQCVKLECLDLLPSALQEAAADQILTLTGLSEGERERLDFTSPSPGAMPLSVMDGSV